MIAATLPDVDSMPAGPEMDALVAELLGDDFGERPEHDWMEHYDSHNDVTCDRCGETRDECCLDHRTARPTGPCIEDPRPYSTDDAAALEVLKRLPGEWGITRRMLTKQKFRADERLPIVASQIVVRLNGEQIAEAPTLALAACRAALRAALKAAAK